VKGSACALPTKPVPLGRWHMSEQRVQRVAERIKEELADILRLVKDPRVGFASIVRVEVSPDLRYAKAFVSVYGPEADQQATMRGLENAKGFIRTELGRRVRLYHTPELHFALDTSIEHGDRIARLLATLPPAERTPAPERKD
jgi:ribosome-binding factor A